MKRMNHYCHTRLHLIFSSKLRIWQVVSLQDGATEWYYNHWLSQPSNQPASQPSTYFNTLALSMLCDVPTLFSKSYQFICQSCLTENVINSPNSLTDKKNDDTVVVGPQVWCFLLGANVIIERFWFQKLTTHSPTHSPTHTQHHSLTPCGPKNKQ